MSDAPATLAASPGRRSPDGRALVASPPDISVSDARLPTTYEAAKTALSECLSIDECKGWADKAEALYARQADDEALLNHCKRIKGRAVRRAGELLKTFDERGAHRKSAPSDTFAQRDAAAEAGMSKRQQTTAVRVANVPEPEFEQAVESDAPPTISQLASQGVKPRQAPAGFSQATNLIGAVKRFAEFCADNDPEFVAGGVMAYECGDLRDHVHAIDVWLDRFVVNLKV